MWEDNNPLSYEDPTASPGFADYSDDDRASSRASDDADTSPPDFLTGHRAHTPSDGSREDVDPSAKQGEAADEEDDDDYVRSRRERGYSSRVEQMLMENKNLPIIITDAGKNHEAGGGFIVYTIRTGDLEVRRRYSEFESLRKNLALLHPCLIVPPIPEKHQVSDYVTAPTSAKENVQIIDHRKRMLGVFLNRCARMVEIRRDSVFHRFLDPNASWSEVVLAPPISNLPRQHLRAPPTDPANPTTAHQYLPLPSASAKLRSASSPPSSSHANPPTFTRFPSTTAPLSEADLDPYFNNYEAATRTYEALLTGSVEKVNRRILKRLGELAVDFNELGARYNAFSLSQTGDLASSIEKVGQAVDSSYIATEELARVLGAGFAEPIRESAQFAGVVQKVLRYRMQKRIQEEMTKDLLQQKRQLLDSLEKSEMEAKRIERILHGEPDHSSRNPSGESVPDDVQSIDSADFPPTHSEQTTTHSPQRSRSISHSNPHASSSSGSAPSSPATSHKKSQSYSSTQSTGGSFLAKGFGKLNYAIHGIVDVDPERTRRDNIGKTKEQLAQLEQAEKVAAEDVEECGKAVLRDLRRFQREKQGDLKSVMRAYAKVQIEWAKKGLEAWEEAGEECEKIVIR